MRKITLLVLLIMPALFGFSQATDLIISEYIEGSSNNKALEIYNGTGNSVDLSDYKIWLVYNGGTWPENTITLSGTLNDGDVFVIANSSADAAILDVADLTTGSASWNGDDAVGLAKDDGTGTFFLIDAVGEDGADPGTGWDVAGESNATANHTLVRKADVCSPNTDWDASRGTNATDSEWIVYSQDDFDYIGSHTANCGGGGVDNPSNFLAETGGTDQIDLSWTQNGNGDDVMVAYTTDGTFGTPADGTSYSAGNAIPGGGTVLYNGNNTTYNHTGLTSGTQYYYKAWSVDASTNYSTGVADNASTLKDEPTNYPTAFTATVKSAVSIENTWTDATGTQVPSGYLILIKDNTGSFTSPVDGTPVNDDTDISDGNGAINVDNGVESYQWTGLSPETTYDFIIYPYTNSGSNINYKTDGTPPTASATTSSANTNLIISEVADPKDNTKARFVELYNTGSSDIDLDAGSWYLSRQANGGSIADNKLDGIIQSGGTYVIATKVSDFNSAYGFDPDEANSNISGNGNDGYFLYLGGNHNSGTLIDAYGVINEDGTGKAWEYKDGKAVRKRSVTSPNSTWTASEWVITRPANVVNMTPGQHLNNVTWQGNSDSLWNTKANWDNGFIPDAGMNVTLPSTTKSPLVSGVKAVCYNLTLQTGSALTVKSDGILTVLNNAGATKTGGYGNTSYSFTIEADNTGQGSVIIGGNASIDAKVEMFFTTSQWHGIATPVSGQTADNLYLNGNPDIWLKYYNENDNTYSYITSLSTPLGNMKGWMMWADSLNGTLNDTVFTFEGALRSGTVSTSESIVRSQAGGNFGYNFVGNPFTSTVNWDDTLGWTKTNLYDAIYIYNDGNWATYIGGNSTNGGSKYIAMNQGFFVQVKDDGSTTGTLKVNKNACVHKSANFMKSNTQKDDNVKLLRLTVSANGMNDETIVKLQKGATEGFDGNYDAHKLFSFNTDRPQIFSTANDKMSINTLPLETGYVDMDVTGKNQTLMTISLTENENINQVWLSDELTGIQTDLTKDDYNFVYDNSITDRFTLLFNITGINGKTTDKPVFNIYNNAGTLNVIIPKNNVANIEVYNLLGQRIVNLKGKQGTNRITLSNGKYYVVKVYNDKTVETKKVFIF